MQVQMYLQDDFSGCTATRTETTTTENAKQLERIRYTNGRLHEFNRPDAIRYCWKILNIVILR